MKSPNERRPVNLAHLSAALSAALALAACGGGGGAPRAALPLAPANGPQSDYPVIVGAPYTVAGTAFTPEDVLNYDQVGYLAVDRSGGSAISGAHHTLPLPSYVEVTSLATGRTILVRLERRGPMEGSELLALSPGALAQLEASGGTPVRVRRVNPPEEQRALLRAGQPVAPRIDTPMSLVDVLKRRLPAQGSAAQLARAPQSAVTPVPVPPSAPSAARTAALAVPAPRTAPAVAAAPGAVPPLPALQPRGAAGPVPAAPTQSVVRADGRFIVQAAAFSTSDRAARVASQLGGEVARAGSVFRVRTGPFATRGEAEASLARVRAAGYNDARIQTSG